MQDDFDGAGRRHHIQVVFARSETSMFLWAHGEVFRLKAILFTRFVILIEQCFFFFLITWLEAFVDLRRIEVDVLWVKQTFVFRHLLLFLIVALFNIVYYLRQQIYKERFVKFYLHLLGIIMLVFYRLDHNGFIIDLYFFLDYLLLFKVVFDFFSFLWPLDIYVSD